MVRVRGGRGKFFRVEGRVREHSCLPAEVSSYDAMTSLKSLNLSIAVL